MPSGKCARTRKLPGAHVVESDLSRVEHDLLGEVVRDDACAHRAPTACGDRGRDRSRCECGPGLAARSFGAARIGAGYRV